MKRLAILTTLALTAAGSAYADHDPYDRYDRDHDRYGEHYGEHAYDGSYDRDRYERYDRSQWGRDFRGRWVPLAQGYSAQRRQFINMRGNWAQFRKLRIEAVRGAPVINQIAIEYRNRDTQVVRLNARLRAGSGEVIRINRNEPINRIIVYTDPGYRGAYTIFGA
ncbi:MAG TPA: hypothetical protein VFQ53_38090 [Kofleriaceae bacterium]|nr:hypothetical protein [Kofleriaceae bacterium]